MNKIDHDYLSDYLEMIEAVALVDAEESRLYASSIEPHPSFDEALQRIESRRKDLVDRLTTLMIQSDWQTDPQAIAQNLRVANGISGGLMTPHLCNDLSETFRLKAVDDFEPTLGNNHNGVTIIHDDCGQAETDQVHDLFVAVDKVEADLAKLAVELGAVAV